MTGRRAALLLTTGLLGCRPGGEAPPASARGVSVLEGYGYPSINDASAAYLTLRNTGASADTVLDFTSSAAGSIMAHRTITEGGVSRMEMLDAVTVGPGETVPMLPGGLHLMLEALPRALNTRDTLSIVVRFARAGTRAARITIRDFGEVP